MTNIPTSKKGRARLMKAREQERRRAKKEGGRERAWERVGERNIGPGAPKILGASDDEHTDIEKGEGEVDVRRWELFLDWLFIDECFLCLAWSSKLPWLAAVC